jgi:hypothetical protein
MSLWLLDTDTVSFSLADHPAPSPMTRLSSQWKVSHIMIDRVRDKITEMAQDSAFQHHKWYVKHHLLIVEQISLALCDIYPNADRAIVLLLVWMHDYGKITRQSTPEATVNGARFLVDHGVSPELAQTIIHSIEIIDRKDVNELMTATIEIQILSSADGAAHMVGPFFSIYWWENSDRSIAELQSSNRRKLQTDWERKIVLPEVKRAFASRYRDRLSDFDDATVPRFKF